MSMSPFSSICPLESGSRARFLDELPGTGMGLLGGGERAIGLELELEVLGGMIGM